MKELVSLPASRWLSVCWSSQPQSKQTRPRRTESRQSEIWGSATVQTINACAFSAPENDIWEYWPCCYGNPTERQLIKMETLQKSQGTGQTDSRHWHQSHRRLTSDSRLLHHFNRNRLGRNDLLPRWLQNTYRQPLETNMLSFFLHSKQQPPVVVEDQTIICHTFLVRFFQNQEYFSHFTCIFWAKTQKLIYYLAIYD